MNESVSMTYIKCAQYLTLSTLCSVQQELSNKANVTDSLNYMSAIFQNMNLNTLHLYMNLKYLYEQFFMQDRHRVITITHIAMPCICLYPTVACVACKNDIAN